MLAVVTDRRPEAVLTEAVALALAENRALVVFGCVFPAAVPGAGTFGSYLAYLPPDSQERIVALQDVVRGTVPQDVCLRLAGAITDHRKSLRRLIGSLQPEVVVVAGTGAHRLRRWARRDCAGICPVQVAGRAG